MLEKMKKTIFGNIKTKEDRKNTLEMLTIQLLLFIVCTAYIPLIEAGSVIYYTMQVLVVLYIISSSFIYAVFLRYYKIMGIKIGAKKFIIYLLLGPIGMVLMTFDCGHRFSKNNIFI